MIGFLLLGTLVDATRGQGGGKVLFLFPLFVLFLGLAKRTSRLSVSQSVLGGAGVRRGYARGGEGAGDGGVLALEGMQP